MTTTTRRRKKRGNQVSLLLTVAFILTFIFLMMTFGNLDSYGDGDKEYMTVIVMPGDSLWSISDKYTPESEDLRRTMHDIITYNELTSEIIYPGQELQVPKVY